MQRGLLVKPPAVEWVVPQRHTLLLYQNTTPPSERGLPEDQNA
jgi:hypothetical protein